MTNNNSMMYLLQRICDLEKTQTSISLDDIANEMFPKHALASDWERLFKHGLVELIGQSYIRCSGNRISGLTQAGRNFINDML